MGVPVVSVLETPLLGPRRAEVMSEIAVAINGYGTIGKRVADAVAAQPDMAVAGVAKTSPNHEAMTALERGFDLYTAIPERADRFAAADLETAGPVEELVELADIVVDATPSGVGAENQSLYEAHDTPALFQGGEDANVADVSFTARANYDAARDAEYVRVVSCNTTGLCRLLTPLAEAYGIEKVRTTLVRRGGDPSQTSRGPINDILPDPVEIPSHHGPDVQTVMPDVDIDTLGLKVPATLMHMHSVSVTLSAQPETHEIRDLLASEDRMLLVPEFWDIDGTGPLKEYALDRGRPRGDIWENAIWRESITTEGRDLYLFQAIHQESDVVPENIDAIRAVTETADVNESMTRTNEALGL
jgi:glyceraldehyde-3-phosphate dehydrogenase (NAD(P))